MSVADSGINFRLKDSPERDDEFFTGRNLAGQLRDVMIQVTMVEARGHFAIKNFLQLIKIQNHSGLRIRLASNGDLENVIVTVTMGIAAFTEDAAVLLCGELRIVIKVRSGEFEFSSQFDHCESAEVT